ncbi:MAG: NADH:flavin oxidoreductase/NADH oxidase [Bryobacterales bacterium]|nr:NADH:flavin oxidoreductase/NADH oxidase [Bryobacterales bacterium]MBV9396580.1 NADH:flavin oxidoreductase/NADH oxidase [Bryobacterales bacterium]
MPHLFDELKIRGVRFPHRLAVSPMCQYSSEDGYPSEWHLVHLGSRAVGGASLVFTEAAAVTAEGRISPKDLGIWSDGHIEAFARITRFIHQQGSVSGIQLAHAGRKASTWAPWDGAGAVPKSQGGWTPVGPSAISFDESYAKPRELTQEEISGVVHSFAQAARRALDAGFMVVEIHAAHGYLLQEFLSPLSNRRDDRYGGSFDNRIRLLGETAAEIRKVWPDRLPLFVRISSTDWAEGGWTVDESVELARRLGPLGVDLIDCSSGGNAPNLKIPLAPGYQTPFAERVRKEAGIATAAVGMITAPAQADHIVTTEQADLVLIARELLRDPYFPLRAARELGRTISWPTQYLRSAPANAPRREPVE